MYCLDQYGVASTKAGFLPTGVLLLRPKANKRKIGLFRVPWPKQIGSVCRQQLSFYSTFYFAKHNFSVEKEQ